MKDIEVRGERTAARRRPDTLDIPRRALLCLKHLLELCDRSHNYVTYIGATLCEDPPHFVHHRLGWTEALPYPIYGLVIARNLTGSLEGAEEQLGQRRLLLSNFNELDGFIHAPKSPWSERYPMDLWEQIRALYALMYWFMDSGEEQVLRYAEGIVDGLFRISWQEGSRRVFSNKHIGACSMGPYTVGSLIDPLLKYHELTGNPKALQVGLGAAHFMLDPANGYFSGEGSFKGFFRTIAAALNGISKAASLTGDPRLLKAAKQLHDEALHRCTTYGSTMCREPACSDMELNMSALWLIRAGFDEYWDQIDRFTRNHTAEAQFLDPGEWVREKALKGRRWPKFKWVTEGYPDDLHILPYDDYRDIVNRSVGGFMWCTADEHQFIPASVMVCCSAHALRTFELVWANALRENANHIAVNLHYNLENRLGEVISYEPFLGKVSVILKKDCDLRIRIPEASLGREVTVECDGRPADMSVRGRYACIRDARRGREYSLRYPLSRRRTRERHYVYEHDHFDAPIGCLEYEAVWRGNTVIQVLPESPEPKRMYKRKHLDTDEVPYRDVSYFITHKTLYDEVCP